MIDRPVAGSLAARPLRWRMILTAVLATGVAFALSSIVFLAILRPRDWDMISAILPPSWPLLLVGSVAFLAGWFVYRAFFRRLGWPLRWLLAFTLGAAFGSLTFFLPGSPPHFGLILVAALFYGPFIVLGAAISAPKQNAATDRENSHG